jgi:light-regulated signal transduction histidine kinase (bacteriophytochrome)
MLSQDYVEILDSEGKRIIENVKRNASKMGRLIDDLLAFSRLGRTEMQLHEIDMDELVKGVLLEINKFTIHKAHIVINRLHPVRGDHNLLFQVI